MNKLAKGVLFAIAGVGGAALLGILALNLYVESTAVQSRMETALSRELRMPVKVGRIHLSPWGKLRVHQLVIPVERGDVSTEFLNIPDVSARVAWGPLLSGRLVVESLTIHSPSVEWAQGKKGKWRLPLTKENKQQKREEKREPKGEEQGVAKAPVSPIAPSETEAPLAIPKEAPESNLAVVEKREKSEKQPSSKDERHPPKRSLEFKIAAARLDHGTFRFLDRKGEPLAVFEGVSVACPVVSQETVSGTANIEKVTFHDKVVIHDVQTPFSYENGVLSLPEIKAQLGGGALSAVYTMHPVDDGAPFVAKLEFKDVGLGELLRDARVGPGTKTDGTLHGKLALEGSSGDEKKVQGGGEVELTNGLMEQNPLAQMIGQALQIEELSRLELQGSRMEYRVGDGRVYIDKLLIESKNLQLSAKGETRFDGKLNLAADLGVTQRISRQFPKWIAQKFVPSETGSVIRFQVTGSLDKPETDLMRVLVGERLEKQAVNLLDAFRAFSKPPKKEKDKRSKKGEKDHEEGTDGPAPVTQSDSKSTPPPKSDSPHGAEKP